MMAAYKVKKIFKYTETVEVEANSESEARDLAMEIDGERNNDDWLYDCEAVKVGADDTATDRGALCGW
jgi:hypothetical protein